MPRINRRRDYRERRAAGEPNPLEPGKPYVSIRPTHVDAYGVRYQIPVSPEYDVVTRVSVFLPSVDQRERRCDGCARSHQRRNRHCSANPQVSKQVYKFNRSIKKINTTCRSPTENR